MKVQKKPTMKKAKELSKMQPSVPRARWATGLLQASGGAVSSKSMKKVIKKPAAIKRPKGYGGTGKLKKTKEGVKALDRKYTDQSAWEKRRAKEQPPPGGWPTPPAHWPPGVRVDLAMPVPWLPEGWGQGIKTTCIAWLRTYISPEGKLYYHKHVVEQVVGKSFGNVTRGSEVQVAWAKRQAKLAIAENKTMDRKPPKFVAEDKLYATLDNKEKAYWVPSAKEFYFAVISARRADDAQGIRNLTNVQAQLTASGCEPVWYVDQASLESYKALGLNAKVGGKLVPARNMALNDAAKAKKPCVQVSDDISRWDFYVGELGRQLDIFDGNKAAKKADRLRISPGAAARFLLAKLRAKAAEEQATTGKASAGPRLAGVFPLGNTGQAFTREAISYDHFILGDFFVADSSPVRFDTKMTLKEDYDFTCAHLHKHGSVLRCNRLFIAAVHETNAGGAVSERDDAGEKERQNIKILREKWPGVFWINGRRGDTQVVMSWKRYKGK